MSIFQIAGFDLFPVDMNGGLPVHGSGLNAFKFYTRNQSYSSAVPIGVSNNPIHQFGQGDYVRNGLVIYAANSADNSWFSFNSVPLKTPKTAKTKKYVRNCFGFRFKYKKESATTAHRIGLNRFTLTNHETSSLLSNGADFYIDFPSKKLGVNIPNVPLIDFEIEPEEEYYFEYQLDTDTSRIDKQTNLKLFIDGELVFTREAYYTTTSFNDIDTGFVLVLKGYGQTSMIVNCHCVYGDYYSTHESADEFSDLVTAPLGPQVVLPLKVNNAVGSDWHKPQQDPVDLLSPENILDDSKYLTVPENLTPLELKFDVIGTTETVNAVEIYHRARKYGTKTLSLPHALKDENDTVLGSRDDLEINKKAFTNYLNAPFALNITADELRESKLVISPEPISE